MKRDWKTYPFEFFKLAAIGVGGPLCWILYWLERMTDPALREEPMTEKELEEWTMRNWIDEATYVELLRRWRFHPAGSPWTKGKIGHYFGKVMEEKKAKLTHSEQVAASKEVGWGE